MKILIFGKNGFLASKLKNNFYKNNVSATFIGSSSIDLTKKSSAMKLKKYNKKCKIIFLSALTPDKGKDEKTFIKNISMISNEKLKSRSPDSVSSVGSVSKAI